MTSQELGRIERPPADRFAGKRKVYLVPLLFPQRDAPQGYSERIDQYWEQVSQQVRSLEQRLSPVKRVYHEFISEGGDDGLKALETTNPAAHKLVLEKCLMGARLEALEDRETLQEMLDWERCLLIGLVSQKVATLVSESHAKASNSRNEHMARVLETTLNPEEAGLLIISERHRVQFPKDIEVFYVNPPALDELRRWLRQQQAEAHAQEQAPEGESQNKQPG